MQSRQMGAEGPTVSLSGLGCNNFGMKLDEAASRAVVQAALEAGVTHFDTAESYGQGRSEEFLGKALGKRRDQVVIATKFAKRPENEPYRPGLLRRRIIEGCDVSLRRLATDRIDIYYQHHPDPEAPLDEMLEAMNDLAEAGKVVQAACSNFSAAQIDQVVTAAAAEASPTARFVASQMHWNLLRREVEEQVVPATRRGGMGIVPYFPLESGLLTGKYAAGEEFPPGSRLAELPRFRSAATEDNLAYVERLKAFAEARGHTLLELALGWLAAQEGVASIITGATKPEQVAANAQAATAWVLDEDDLQAVPRRG